jgi:hypothetical protein
MFRGTAIRLVRRRPQAFAFVEIMGPEQVTVPDAMITLHNWAHDVNGDGVGGVGTCKRVGRANFSPGSSLFSYR